MREKIMMMLTALLALAGRATATEESVSVAGITVEPGGEAFLEIDYSLGSGTYVGFMFQVVLPEGLSLAEDPDDPGYPWYDDEVTAISKMNITATATGGFAATPKKASSTINGNSGVLMRLKVKADMSIAPGTYTGRLTEVSFNLRDDSYNVTKSKLSDVSFNVTIEGGGGTVAAESVSVADINVETGSETVLDISYQLPDEGTYVGFMFQMVLPEGLSLAEDPDDPGYPWYDDEVTAISKMNITPTPTGGFAATPKKASSTINGNSGVLMRLKVKADASIAPGTYTGRLTEVSFNLRDDSYNVTKSKLSDVTFDITVTGSGSTTQTLTLVKGWNWVSSPLQEPLPLAQLKENCSRIVGQEQELIRDPQFGMTGGLTTLESGKAYKVLADEAVTLTLSGQPHDDTTARVELKKGWNWMAYPCGEAKSIAAAITNAEAGDTMVSQDGTTATYNGSSWTGTLTLLTPGQGFLYRSTSDKTLRFHVW